MFVFLGWKKENTEERDAQMPAVYRDSIEYFPEKIDQLIAVLNRVSSMMTTISIFLIELMFSSFT